LIDRLLRTLLRNGVRKGLMGNSRTWTVVAVFAGALRLKQWLNRRESTVVYREELQPGETLVIAHEREPQ
jgi:hypothetical protein